MMLREGFTIDRGGTIRECSDEREALLVRVRLTEKLDAIPTHGIPTAAFSNGIADGHHVANGSWRRWTRHETGAGTGRATRGGGTTTRRLGTRATALSSPGASSSNCTSASNVALSARWIGTARARLATPGAGATRARLATPGAGATRARLATRYGLATACGG